MGSSWPLSVSAAALAELKSSNAYFLSRSASEVVRVCRLPLTVSRSFLTSLARRALGHLSTEASLPLAFLRLAFAPSMAAFAWSLSPANPGSAPGARRRAAGRLPSVRRSRFPRLVRGGLRHLGRVDRLRQQLVHHRVGADEHEPPVLAVQLGHRLVDPGGRERPVVRSELAGPGVPRRRERAGGEIEVVLNCLVRKGLAEEQRGHKKKEGQNGRASEPDPAAPRRAGSAVLGSHRLAAGGRSRLVCLIYKGHGGAFTISTIVTPPAAGMHGRVDAPAHALRWPRRPPSIPGW